MTTNSRIKVLPPLLINKIAAGEVVERPASVVKELVENALDAGATRITIEVADGGRELIRVTDDGYGMTAEELRLAVHPHATSKILSEEDLFGIATLGFRGEALASISSVSKMRIVSRTADSPEGHEIRVIGEQVEASQAAGCPIGTTVEVRDLFFNVPARRKFLRSNSTEVGHIHDQLARVALPHPQVSFELINNGRVTMQLPACRERPERVAKFYSPELAAALLRVEREERGLHLELHVAPPAHSRATPQWQYTFLNGRYVRDRFLQHAIKEAHRGLMEPNRHGVVFLFITIDPHLVDVNVHPTKIEVRWADSSLVHSQVLSLIRETFQRHELAHPLRTDRATPPVDAAEQDRIRAELAEVLKNTMPMVGGAGAAPGVLVGGVNSSPNWSPSVPPGGSRMDSEAVWRSLYGAPTVAPQSASPSASFGAGGAIPRMEALRPKAIQLHNLYLVSETEDGILIIDQHALHERVMYEELRARFTAGPLESQRLLLPETLRVTPAQVSLLEHNADLLTKLGIEWTTFGPDSIAVQSFPSLLRDTDVIPFLRDLLDQLAQVGSNTQAEVVIHRILDMMACKAAVKAGDPLTDQEITALLERRHLIDKPSNCPHGRPTMLRLTKSDLERQFKRT